MISVMLVLLLVLMLLRAPVAVALGLPAMLWLLSQDLPVSVTTQRIYGTLNNSVLLAVPMFLLAGRLMNLLGVTERTGPKRSMVFCRTKRSSCASSSSVKPE